MTLCFDGTLQRSWSALWRAASRAADVPNVMPAASMEVRRATATHQVPQAPSGTSRGRIKLETVTVRARVSEPARPERPPAVLAPMAVNADSPAEATGLPEAALAAADTPAAPAQVPAAAPRDIPLQPPPLRGTQSDFAPLHAPKAVAMAPPRAASPAPERRVSEAEAIRQALREYERAFESLDVAATARVWPSVNRRALARAFGSIRSQGLTFDHCEIEVNDASATATCNGVIQFVPKVGSAAPARAEHEWLFRMQKSDSDWKIRTVTAYQPAAPAVMRASGTQ